MQKIILCDTNAVIQLSIVSTKVFSKNDVYELILNKEVFSELKGLLKNPEKKDRLGTDLEWVIKNVPVSKGYDLPSDWKEIDEVYQLQELGMSSSDKSSPTGTNDRKFLIVADYHDICLLTREKTLYNLSKNIIGLERTYGVSDFLIICRDEKILTIKEIQAGVTKLATKKETLPDRCKKHLKDIGIRV